jgi:hypothetical protein
VGNTETGNGTIDMKLKGLRAAFPEAMDPGGAPDVTTDCAGVAVRFPVVVSRVCDSMTLGSIFGKCSKFVLWPLLSFTHVSVINVICTV